MSVLVVGTVAFDSIETPSDRLSAFSAVRPLILPWARVFSRRSGSSVSSARIFPRSISICFTQRKSTRGHQTRAGDTFHWRGRYHEDINVRDTLELHLNVLAGFVPHLPESYRNAEYVFLGNIDPVMQIEVLNQIRAHEAGDLRHDGSLDLAKAPRS